MAEVIAVTAFCFSCINFFLSTIPTGVKVTKAYLDCAEKFRHYKCKLAGLDDSFTQWRIIWEDFDLGRRKEPVAEILRNMQDLRKRMEEEMKKHTLTTAEEKRWKQMRRRLEKGKYRAPPVDNTPAPGKLEKSAWNARRIFGLPEKEDKKFRRSVSYVLWKKDIIEDWLKSMTESLDMAEKLCEQELNEQTAGDFEPNSQKRKTEDVTHLKAYILNLETLAATLRTECIAIQETDNWALGLRAPGFGRDVASWRKVSGVNIELRFTKEQFHYNLRVPYQKEDPQTHASEGKISEFLSNHMTNPDNATLSTSGIQLTVRNPRTFRTRPIGSLFKSQPELFRETSESRRRWEFDRMGLVLGALNWAILLWNTSWLSDLCCDGLQIEKDMDALDRCMQTFTVTERNQHPLNLRNLGVVLAEIFLETPIRVTHDDLIQELGYERFVGGRWEKISPLKIGDEVVAKTISAQLRDAVFFCLTSKSALEEYHPGLLLRFIDEIYTPVNEWYKDENSNVKPYAESLKRIPMRVKRKEWPMGAMDLPAEPWQLSHFLLDLLRIDYFPFDKTNTYFLKSAGVRIFILQLIWTAVVACTVVILMGR
ncbi:hypothetical protein CC80DRAFT_538495 [Byssothecium circinans]|uniref:Uncharacterized protein n=1 Tax=Byssothecium circinans TaxID=147558 RepID=A0A6A5TK10_9PLEO|nr:hypothetical protein CC80DRAFT_538495 [Byssothecium circinans]